MTRFRRLRLLAAAGMIMALAYGGAPALQAHAAGPVTVTVNATADVPGVDTGVDVTQGENLTITASGTASCNKYSGTACDTGPDGYTGTDTGFQHCYTYGAHDCPLSNDPYGVLIGQIRSADGATALSPYFRVGSHYSSQALASGRLFLIYDDCYGGCYSDNSGSYNATISTGADSAGCGGAACTNTIGITAITGKPGVNTGITVTPGQHVTITTPPIVNTAQHIDLCGGCDAGPDGSSAYPSCGTSSDCSISSDADGTIEGRIGTSGDYFHVGSSHTLSDSEIGTGGPLYLIVNDSYYPDNYGNFSTTITYPAQIHGCTGFDCGNGTPTPELGSGELLATGLLPVGAILLYRRMRRKQRMDA